MWHFPDEALNHLCGELLNELQTKFHYPALINHNLAKIFI